MGVSDHGEENEYTIIAGIGYAINLQKANRGREACDLITMLLNIQTRKFLVLITMYPRDASIYIRRTLIK